jgi:hypothetical protein
MTVEHFENCPKISRRNLACAVAPLFGEKLPKLSLKRLGITIQV